MGRPKQRVTKTVVVSVRLTEAEARDLDARRRGLSRSAYLRALFKRGGEALSKDP